MLRTVAKHVSTILNRDPNRPFAEFAHEWRLWRFFSTRMNASSGISSKSLTLRCSSMSSARMRVRHSKDSNCRAMKGSN